jgi:hypothetical protein
MRDGTGEQATFGESYEILTMGNPQAFLQILHVRLARPAARPPP